MCFTVPVLGVPEIPRSCTGVLDMKEKAVIMVPRTPHCPGHALLAASHGQPSEPPRPHFHKAWLPPLCNQQSLLALNTRVLPHNTIPGQTIFLCNLRRLPISSPKRLYVTEKGTVSNSISFFFFQILVFTFSLERQTHRHRQGSSICHFTPQMHTTANRVPG